MGRGLSDLQQMILRLAYQGYTHDNKDEFSGRRVDCRYSTVVSLVYGERDNKASAAVSRAVRRLMERGLIETRGFLCNGGPKARDGVNLTSTGLEAARTLNG